MIVNIKNIKKFTKLKSTMYKALRNEEYSKTYSYLLKLFELCPFNSELFVILSMILNLTNDEKIQEEYANVKVNTILEMAILINSNDIDAYIELGDFYYAQEDNPAKALKFFEKGLEKAKDQELELNIGKINCLVEINRVDDAKMLYDKMINEYGENKKLTECAKYFE